MKIGDHVHIGAGSIVEAATIGNHVEIGKNCIIVFLSILPEVSELTPLVQGKFTIIKDCARIADNTIIPPNTVVPALALFSGSPGSAHSGFHALLYSTIVTGQFMEDLPESTQEIVEAQTKQFYTRFQPLER